MTLPSEKPATDVAAQCFLNALIRETTDWKLTHRLETDRIPARRIAHPAG
ncbi:siderophore biosynthesis protein [Escherichia coli]|nr:siderophore biosynthesis protein [Escherichia coli]